jgi:hypothetical protein
VKPRTGNIRPPARLCDPLVAADWLTAAEVAEYDAGYTDNVWSQYNAIILRAKACKEWEILTFGRLLDDAARKALYGSVPPFAKSRNEGI